MGKASIVTAAGAVAYQWLPRFVEVVQTEVAHCAIWKNWTNTMGAVHIVTHLLVTIESMLLLLRSRRLPRRLPRLAIAVIVGPAARWRLQIALTHFCLGD
jgi:hypothetical protein